jgi:hypothetical protein
MTRLACRFALNRVAVGGIAAALLTAAPAQAHAQDETAPAPLESETEANAPLSKGEQQLAKLLEGRVAGEPVDCIRSLPSEQMRTIDGTAYVFGRGQTIYVQRTRNPQDISQRNAIISLRFSPTQLCRMDILNTVDPMIGFFTGVVTMDDFIPYTRARQAK